MIDKMGFIVCDKNGKLVKVLKYLVDEGCRGKSKKGLKGLRELKKLKWEMNDGEMVEDNCKRLGRGISATVKQ